MSPEDLHCGKHLGSAGAEVHRGNPSSEGTLSGIPIPVAWVCHREGIPASAAELSGVPTSVTVTGQVVGGVFRLRRRGLSEV